VANLQLSTAPKFNSVEKIGLASVAISYLAARIIQWILSLPVIFGPDSHSFVPGPGLTGVPNGYFGFEKVALTGEGVIRPWTVTLPYALLGADFIRSFAQMLFSAGAFLFLAWVLLRVVRPRPLGLVVALIALVISLTTLVTSWDMLINRESIAISLTSLFLAFSVLSLVDLRWRVYLGANLMALLLTITRPTIAPLTVGVLACLLLIRLQSSTPATRHTSLTTAVVGGGLMLVTIAYPAWMSNRIDASWEQWYGHTMSETQFGYVVSDYNPRADSLKAALADSGAPRCLIDSLPVYTGEYLGAPWGFAAYMRDTCPGFQEWYEENWPNWYYGYVVKNPDYVGKLTISGLPLALRTWDNGATTSLLPASVRNLVFPEQAGEEELGTYDPLFLYWSIVLGFGLTLLILMRSRCRGWFSKYWQWIALITAITLGSLVSIVVNLLLIPSYALETNRINVSTVLVLRGVGLIAAAVLVWRFTMSLRDVRKLRNSVMSRGPDRTVE
jgi:hypothetical protein